MSDDRYRWQPGSPAQKAALDSQADILFFGGAAGSLKTATMLMDAVQEYENPHLRAIIFRSSYSEMTDILDKTNSMYPPLGGTYVGSPKYTWTFKSGAKIRFGYVKTDEDWKKYLGPRYSFIGWDESTAHTEKQVRNLLGRLSSTDRTLRLRCRLGSNPGGIGASWHQEVFLRGPFCPVHDLGKCATPGKLYTDRKWSDGKAIPFSVSFIPGRLTDHTLLDADYSKRLNMMAGADAAAMELGCWCRLEGSYFPFLNSDYIKPLADCGIEWWHNHFISIDYGYGQSWSAAGLYARSPGEVKRKVVIPGIDPALLGDGKPVFAGGRIRKIAEILVPMTPIDVFAQMIVDNFVAPGPGEERRCIIAVFLDPNNFNPSFDSRAGTGGHSYSDQIDRILEPWGLSCQMASNNRAAGWQLLYRMLRDGEFEITDQCPETFESIRTRLINPKKSGDILKIEGSELDDVADETRYALFTFVNPADKPRELVLKEAIEGFDRTTREGMTSSAIRYQEAADKFDQGEEPLRLGGRRLGMGRRR